MQTLTKDTKQQPQIIGLSGKQFAGKDAVARILLQHLPDHCQLPIAQAIKQQYAEQQSITLQAVEQNKAHHRPGLIALGNWGRAQDPDYWLKAIIAASETSGIIISDVRLKREFNLLREHDAFLIRVEASRTIREQRGTLVSEEDITECDLDDMTNWDAIINNNGTEAALATEVNTLFPLI